jgi:CHASE2 domain-containing sensor protein
VVASALGDPSLAYGASLPQGTVTVQFPFVTQAKPFTAWVTVWKAAQDTIDSTLEDSEDIAVLELEAGRPREAQCLSLVEESDLSGHPFQVFGYPRAHNAAGIWTGGTLSQHLPNRRIQVEGLKAQGVPIEPGFSGSPLWDEHLRAVVGIVVAADERPEVKVAFIIPTGVLRRVYAQIPVQSKPFSRRLQQLWRSKRSRTVLLSPIALVLVNLLVYPWLQSGELRLYDQFMRLRPDEDRDNRLLVIEITQTDIAKYSDSDKVRLDRASLPEEAYEVLFKRLEDYDPVTVGLDIYRESAVVGEFEYLKSKLGSNPDLIVICNVPGETEQGNRPPPEVQNQQSRIGFSDLSPDTNNVIRRQRLWMKAADTRVTNDICLTNYAFSLQLARRYLEKSQGINFKELDGGYQRRFYLGNTELTALRESAPGGYEDVDPGGYQVLLNYRRFQGSPKNFVQRLSLEEFLAKPVTESDKQRLILIGVVDPPNKGDNKWLTPYGYNTREDTLPGVLIHAQITSQILSAVLDRRPFIRPSSDLEIIGWVLGWYGLGSLIVWHFYRSRGVILTLIGVTLGTLCLVCYVFFLRFSLWFPILSPAIALATPALVGFVVYTRFQARPD